MNSTPRKPSRLLLALCMALPQVNMAADITVQPPAGGGFAVRDSADTTDRFRVDEAGTVRIPAINSATQQDVVTCFEAATGQLGPCSSSVTGVTGPAGPTGAIGPTGPTGPIGATGANGTNMLSGAGGPTAGIGSDGDFYFDTTSAVVYGPKAAGAWPSPGTSLIGPTGPVGAIGDTGPQGAQGIQGIQGLQGTAGTDGVDGATGPTGPAGAVGATGPTGPAGSSSVSLTTYTSTVESPVGMYVQITASCASGNVVSGGCGSSDNGSLGDVLVSSYPAGATSWVCVYAVSGPTHTAYALCQ